MIGPLVQALKILLIERGAMLLKFGDGPQSVARSDVKKVPERGEVAEARYFAGLDLSPDLLG